MSPWAILGAVVLAGAAGFGLGSRLKQGEWDTAALAGKDAQAAALQAAAAEIAKIDIKQQTIVQKVQHEITEKTVYRDCRVPGDGIRLLNDAIGGAEPAGGGGVPSAPASP